MKKLIANLVWLSFISISLIACGGGGGGGGSTATKTTTISGVAAAGVPIIGTATIKDSSTPPVERTVNIPVEANGIYEIDVTGLKAPFMLRADGKVGGRDYTCYSAATSADIGGKINITPFTDLIVANMAGQVAAEFYAGNNFGGLTTEKLNEQRDALQAKLQPIMKAMGMTEGIDILRTSFNTDHTGLDAIIDVVQIEVDTSTKIATIRNILNNETITSNIAAKTITGTFTEDLSIKQGVSDIQAITDVWTKFSQFFATSLPSLTNPVFVALFDADLLDRGQGRDAWLTELVTDQKIIGLKITSVSIKQDISDLTAGYAWVSLSGVQNGQPFDETTDGPEAMKMVKKNNVWQISGNREIADLGINAYAEYRPPLYSGSTPNYFQTGLNISVHANTPAGAGVASAVVTGSTGSGLPTAGVTLTRQIEYDWFSIQGQNSGNLYTSMNDATIGAIPDNAVYTFRLLDHSGAVLQTSTRTLRKRPLMRSELSSASFPVITVPTVDALRAFTGGNLAVTWTLPAGLSSNYMSLHLYDSQWQNRAEAKSDLFSYERSKTLAIQPITSTGVPFTVANRWLYVQARDSYNRSFSTIMEP